MSKKFSIAMDMDGVLYPFDEAFNKLIVAAGGEALPFDKWVDFNLDFDPVLSRKVWKDARLFKMSAPYPNAVQAMEQLNDMEDVEVFIVTNVGKNPQISFPAKWAWLNKWFPWIQPWQVITMRQKWLLDTNMIVDDHHKTVKKWANQRMGYPVMIRRPWNRELTDENAKKRGIIVENSIAPVVGLVQTILSKNGV